MPLNSQITLPLTPGLYEIRTPSITVRLNEKFTDETAVDPQTGKNQPKERWRATLFGANGSNEGLKVYEMDGSYVAMQGVQSGLDLIRRIGD